MNKYNKWHLILSSILILLPAMLGLLFWHELPVQMITHWNLEGQADGWSSRSFAVFALPLFLLAFHWLCIFITVKDHRNQKQNAKVLHLVLWILPAVSLFSSFMMYAASFGQALQPLRITYLLLGTTFLVIGNYMPKVRPNRTIGIKIKWTLENEENWYATHRFAGKIWVIGGALFMLCALLPDVGASQAVTITSIVLLIVVPIVYSYGYHRKQIREGTASIHPLPKTKPSRMYRMISSIALVVIPLLVALLMFTGSIHVTCQEESFTIKASYWHDLTVEYDAVSSIEFREDDNRGIRTSGFGSPHLLMGAFQNDEFGSYTRYSYTQCNACIVLNVSGRILVINGRNADSTRDIFEALQTAIWGT